MFASALNQTTGELLPTPALVYTRTNRAGMRGHFRLKRTHLANLIVRPIMFFVDYLSLRSFGATMSR